MDWIVNRAIEREHALMEMLKTRTPFVETYLQDLKFRPQEGPTPVQDHYFLGRMDLSESMNRRDYLAKDTSFESHLLGGFTRLFKFEYKPLGFSWMIYADRDNFNRQTYDFRYVRREFLGDVRCVVFEVSPKKGTGHGRFHGRIWVEDQDYNIVRLNGTYEPRPSNAYFFHMDSWRLNLIPDYWVPAYVYSEEGDFSEGSKDKTAFKAHYDRFHESFKSYFFNIADNGYSDWVQYLVEPNGEELFFHVTSLAPGVEPSFADGQPVTYEVQFGVKGPQAVNVAPYHPQ